ncbi:hypothetical protein FOZ60_006585 [Perkinsus olseni]|uniref:CCHC-type domain-containing protein n=2 Tax=Perkinsus olseni TaxID=32597 RepID=A0A7J6NNL9_PEROL|nr:hypothetical protein FOZ60_006585 [Perkinsus olseni]
MALYSHVIVENVCDVNGPHGTIWKALTYDEDVLAEIVLEGLDAQGLRRVYPQHCRVAEVVHHVITATRGHMTSNWCYGCKRRHCENPISVKDFDTMQNVIRTLRPDTTFEGAKDSRSGTTWISVMYHETEGHPDVVRCLWLKKYTSSRVWKEITGGLTPPSRCYQDYERQVDKILKQFRRTFDTDEHLHKTEHLFNNCVQGNDSVYAFVERLEDLSSELYHLGSPVLEYKMKWKLYNGLKGAELRLRVNDYLDDREIDYMEFKEVVLRQHRRMTNVNEADNNTKPSDKKTRDDSRGSYGRRSDDSGYRSRRPWQQRPPYPRRESVNSVDDSGGYTTDDNEVRQHHVNMGRDLSGLKCYRCLKRGHSAKDCEQPEPADLSTRCRICGNPQHQAETCKIKSDKLVCHRCNNPGHLAYVCTSKTPTSSPTTGKRQSTPRSTARVQVIIDNDRLQEHPQQRVCTTSSSSDRDTSRAAKPMVMVIGNVCIEDNVIPALFDTGAEVSLITRQALQRLAPHVDVYTNTPRHISVADGGTLHVDGTVMLKVSTNRITVHDEFIVVSDDLSVPILLGCPTLGKLRTTIRVSPHGMHVTTNDDHDFSPYSAPKEVRFNDNVSTCDELLKKDQEDITVTYTINHVRRLFLHQDSHSGLSDVELYNALFPTTRIYPDDLFVGQADCNQSGKDPTSSNYYVHYMSTDPTETSPNVESATPHHDENNDKEDVDHDSDDNLPPWDVLQRHWMWDATTPLGRACVRLPWLGEERPPNNFKNAAHRGAASTRRLSPEQRQAFEAALQVYTTRGFCAIVKDNYVNGNFDHPTFDECQAAWDAMTRDTALDGTVVIKPYHYTPSHMVFRDSHPTTPCRIVLDFRTLNKFTRRGGKTQNDLQGVLLQLRSFPYFISADVSKAFCQMKASLYDEEVNDESNNDKKKWKKTLYDRQYYPTGHLEGYVGVQRSLVVTVDDWYTGLARVVDDDGNGNVKTVDNNDKDCFNTAIENVIYVRPSSRSLTRARGRELVELLDYVNGHLPPN